MSEFEFFQKIADSYSVEDILCMLDITPYELCKRYLRHEILSNKELFDV